MGGQDMDLSDLTMPPSLMIFKADGMKLKTFPNFSNAAVLEILSFATNNFSFIPDNIIKTISRSLTSLSLGRCKIQEMPSVTHLTKLKKLWFSINQIPRISRNTIKTVTNLNVFNLRENDIQIMPNLSYLSSLQWVLLQSNSIRYIPGSALLGLPKLKSLGLTGNMVSYVEDLPVPICDKLYLDGNQLAIPPDVFGSPLRTLHIGGNPLICNQSLCWLRMWPWFNTLPNVDNPACTEPADLFGVDVMTVHPVRLKCYRG